MSIQRSPARTRGRGRAGTRASQRGVTAVFTTIAMLTLIGMAGLALDMGHAYVNKTRLQNALDAAALSAATTLDKTGDTAQASVAAWTAFSKNAAAAGNGELAGIKPGDLSVAYSHTLKPFTAGSAPPMFVRTSVPNLSLDSWFISVLGIGSKSVGASAVAGPSPQFNCATIPVMACGDKDDKDDPADPSDSVYGYTVGQDVVLKAGKGNDGWAVGPGNFQLANANGGKEVKDGMAGGEVSCNAPGNLIPTETGNKVGPTLKGLNTRFGDYEGEMKGTESEYPPDKVTDAGSTGYPDTYADYEKDYSDGNVDVLTGKENRRVVVVSIGNCTGTTQGAGTVGLLGYGCFFLSSPATKGGHQEIRGQFIRNCPSGVNWGANPTFGSGPYRIILYKDYAGAGSLDS